MTQPANNQMHSWSDSLSAAWERHRTRLFENERHVSEWLIDRVDPKPGQTILEIACGPGETGFLAAERIGRSGRLIATDLGPGMINAAQRGAIDRGLSNVECRVMDAQEIDLPDASVDGVLCRFGIMLMPEPERAIAGARRVLRPGSRLAFATWGPPDRNPWMSLFAMALLQAGEQPPGNPFEAGGPFSLSDPEQNRELVIRAGFTDPRVEELTGVHVHTNFDDYWNLQAEVSGPIALHLATLPPQRVELVREAAATLLEPFASDGGYALPSMALGIVATAP